MWFTSSLCHPRHSTARVERTSQLSRNAGMSPERIPPPQGPNLSWLQRPERASTQRGDRNGPTFPSSAQRLAAGLARRCLPTRRKATRLNLPVGHRNADRVAASPTRRTQGASSSGPLARHKPTGSCVSLLPRSPQPHPWHRTSMADRQLFTAAASRPAQSPTRRPPRMVSRGHLSGPRKRRKELSTDYTDYTDS